MRFVLAYAGLVRVLVACDGTDPASGALGPRSSCIEQIDCDDGLDCTVDSCIVDPAVDADLRFCAWSIATGRCFINGVCASDGAHRANNACEVCDATRPQQWSSVGDGTPCDDGSACTTADTCVAGLCGGAALECGDGNACTRDACAPASGCTHSPLDGFTCDDGLRCTIGDRCEGSSCGGIVDACDDGDPCTVDACSEVVGCTHTTEDGLGCDDGNACTARDTCEDGACSAGPDADCDDGNSCTIDTCHPDAGCVHLPTLSPCCAGEVSVCDDGNPCTDDACDPATFACTHRANRAPCDDQDPCSDADTCADEVCVGGPDVACDDGNPCTVDVCNASFPGLCLHEPSSGRCDDGLACTTDDTCVAGACTGDASDCVCVPDLGSDGVKLTSVQIGTGGSPGEGLDVDANAATCAPGGCIGGVDNTLSILSGLANEQLDAAVRAGDAQLVVAFGPLTSSPIEVAFYQARLAGTNTRCNVQTQTCDWLVDKSFLDATCEPIAHLAATLTGNRLVGGGPGTRLPFTIPFNGADLDVVLANLRIEADLTIAAGQVTALTGVLGGAVPKATLIAGLQGLPDDALPISKDAALSLVESLVQNDIDTDRDGVKDAASIGIKLIAIDARVVGVTP